MKAFGHRLALVAALAAIAVAAAAGVAAAYSSTDTSHYDAFADLTGLD